MRALLIVALLVAASPILENPHVRAYRSKDGSLDGVAHGPGVVIAIADAPGVKAGSASGPRTRHGRTPEQRTVPLSSCSRFAAPAQSASRPPDRNRARARSPA